MQTLRTKQILPGDLYSEECMCVMMAGNSNFTVTSILRSVCDDGKLFNIVGFCY